MDGKRLFFVAPVALLCCLMLLTGCRPSVEDARAPAFAYFQYSGGGVLDGGGWRDDFDAAALGERWAFPPTRPEHPWWSVAKGGLTLNSTAHTIREDAPSSLVGVKRQAGDFQAQTELRYQPRREGDVAGIVYYRDAAHNFVFGKAVDAGGAPVIVLDRAQATVKRLAEIKIDKGRQGKAVTLKVTGEGDAYSFHASFDGGGHWIAVVESVDAPADAAPAGGFAIPGFPPPPAPAPGAAPPVEEFVGLYTYANPAPVRDNPVPWEEGGFETRRYRNMFAEAGYPQAEIDKRLKGIFHEVFEGPDRVYFEVGEDMAYISDLKNHDVRTEGMSYGMMVAVQFDRRDVFDRLWRWSKKYMQHRDGPMKGYFAWSLKTDGTHNAEGPASDGELYYVTSLIFASNRWGDDGGIDYLKEARHILDCAFAKDGTGDIANFIDERRHLITFVPDGAGSGWTDPSYHIPAFYEVWARWADDGRADFWRECARATREYLHKSVDPVTALNPDQNNFDGSVMVRQMPSGATFRNETFRFDSWRVPMNIALDYSWCAADKDWQREYSGKFQDFLYLQGVRTFVDQFDMDGSAPQWILPAGGKAKLRHSVGLVGTAAAVSLASTRAKSYEFIDHFWETENVPYDDGYFDAYYDGLLRLFAFMHLSGNYRVIFPAE
ncbi:MAG: hypothetical protein LBT74_06560 [Acidobacteriota bacterium]|jgi:endo-1,4-beta-D-glucanase Y|nr:hypothetical protein [Acidobacteriota bacterium]